MKKEVVIAVVVGLLFITVSLFLAEKGLKGDTKMAPEVAVFDSEELECFSIPEGSEVQVITFDEVFEEKPEPREFYVCWDGLPEDSQFTKEILVTYEVGEGGPIKEFDNCIRVREVIE